MWLTLEGRFCACIHRLYWSALTSTRIPFEPRAGLGGHARTKGEFWSRWLGRWSGRWLGRWWGRWWGGHHLACARDEHGSRLEDRRRRIGRGVRAQREAWVAPWGGEARHVRMCSCAGAEDRQRGVLLGMQAGGGEGPQARWSGVSCAGRGPGGGWSPRHGPKAVNSASLRLLPPLIDCRDQLGRRRALPTGCRCWGVRGPPCPRSCHYAASCHSTASNAGLWRPTWPPLRGPRSLQQAQNH